MYYISSDLHLEFFVKREIDILIKKVENNVKDDPYENRILLLAGDVCTAKNDNLTYYLNSMQDLFSKIIYVPGNHEYYGSSIENGNILLNEKIDKLNERVNNIYFLNNGRYHDKKNNIMIIGTVLWSDLSYNNSDITLAKYIINDFNYIHNFRPLDYQNMFNNNSKFLEEELKKYADSDKIVITHHMPSYDLVDEKYRNENNVCFTSDMSYLFNRSIKAWIYGHTHSATEQTINGILFKCNPIGYKGENEKFKVIDVLTL